MIKGNFKLKLKTILLIVTMLVGSAMFAHDNRAKIKDYLNKEIIIKDRSSGQSITLIEENNNYFILRKFFGSGVPLTHSSKYKVVFNSDYQIAFSDLVESQPDKSMNEKKENFLLAVEENGLCLYLNSLRVVIDYKTLLQDKY